MVFIVLQVLFILLVPIGAEALHRTRTFSWLSPVLLCYAAGMLVANLPGIPLNPEVSKTFTEAAVPLAIPLLLFSTDFMAWIRRGGSAMLSFLAAMVVVSGCAYAAGIVYADRLEESWMVAGMLVGVYTGGTPNLLSIGMAVGVSEETYILLNAADVVVSGVYLAFLLTIGPTVLGWVLPAFQAKEQAEPPVDAAPAVAPSVAPSKGALARGMGLGWLLSVGILALSAGIAQVLTGTLHVAVVIFGLTTFGILASFDPRVRALPGTSALGNYFINVFCVAIGALTNFGDLAAASSTILEVTALVFFSSLILHFFLTVVLRIDRDTVLITSTAAIFGPAFVPAMVAKLENPDMLLSGLTTGLVGYAVGNYLGLAVAYALQP